jgi:glucosyl-3-phosphoglycerate synthase
MITVIIPVLNESETISSVISLAKSSSYVSEVIVVDDGSIDGTPELAFAAGATVITSTLLGKGASMYDGVRAAKNDFLLFLDGDLQGLCPNLINKMSSPLLLDEADFVKAKFSRAAGRVTTLTAKPLIYTYFPELAHFEQPLGGIIAARRSLLSCLTFENDYGVDIGLFIDAAAAKARLVEVDIGHIEHDSHPLEVLGDMAMQVTRTILDRASRHGRLRASYIREVQENERHQRAQLPNLFQKLPKMDRLALFDMDGVLLNGRYIVELASRTGKTTELNSFLDRFDIAPDERTRQIASIFKGVPREVFERTAMEMPLTTGAIETIVGLRKAGFRVGIVTDSFHVASEIVRRRVFADFSFANLMRFKSGKASGRVTLAPAMFHPAGCSQHEHCKVNALLHLIEKMGITKENVLAVGDGLNDVCMLLKSGCSVAFQPKAPAVAAAAQTIITHSLSDVLKIAQA